MFLLCWVESRPRERPALGLLADDLIAEAGAGVLCPPPSQTTVWPKLVQVYPADAVMTDASRARAASVRRMSGSFLCEARRDGRLDERISPQVKSVRKGNLTRSENNCGWVPVGYALLVMPSLRRARATSTIWRFSPSEASSQSVQRAGETVTCGEVHLRLKLAVMEASNHPLRAWRKGKGLDQAKMAGLVGVAPSMISQIETGKKWPSLALATRIERVTDKDIRAAELAPAEDAAR